MPLNSLWLVAIICALLALIYIGSTTAFSALVSLPLITLYISYVIPILFILIRKVRGQHPQYGPFKLGRWGIPINLFAVVYIFYILSFIPLPTIMPVTAVNMNYAGPLAVAVIFLALADWLFSGRFRFHVPVLKRDL
jgi:choline transport protein